MLIASDIFNKIQIIETIDFSGSSTAIIRSIL
jgi:hypothetical protein